MHPTTVYSTAEYVWPPARGELNRSKHKGRKEDKRKKVKRGDAYQGAENGDRK